ncbi:MAG: biopolymer transporter ExbD [Nitrosomonadales bacterium]|nr:MAG: biopolymer transporter ExbD [Nitrosomonadales bacterium]
MNFQRGRLKEEPEINLIPMIDVLLVILIFLMVTTTFSQIAELQINLPTADAEKQAEKPNEITVAVDASGHYVINRAPLANPGVDALSEALRRAAGDRPDPVIVINADAEATHQSVINIMEASRLAGYSRISFATQAKNGK